MKTPRSFLLFLAALFFLLTARPAQARVEVDFDFFYDSLTPHGEWLQVADYGYCWRPTTVDRDWSPYSDGYWAFTDAGWTWVSYEEFGGIVYHYGRWVRVEDEGWCWQPDYEWAPAWVSWRQNDDYVGWAPLPPEARWRPSVGISIWVDREYDIGPASYNFCRSRDFGAPVLRPVIVNRYENVTIIRRTVNITNITYNTTDAESPIIYNGGPSYTVINERSSRRVPTLKLVQNTEFRGEGWREVRDGDRRDRRRDFNAQAVGNQLIVTAPIVRPPADAGFLRQKVTREAVSADRVNRGWSGVKSEEVRRDLRQEMQRQTKGLTPDSAPARPLAAAELKMVPEKADANAKPTAAVADERRDRPDRKNRPPGSAIEPDKSPAATVGSAVTPAANEQTTSVPIPEKGRAGVAKDQRKPGAERKSAEAATDPAKLIVRDPNPAAPVSVAPADLRTVDEAKKRREGREGRKPVEETAEIDRTNKPPAGVGRSGVDEQAIAEQQKAKAAQEGRMRQQAENEDAQRRQAEQAAARKAQRDAQERAAGEQKAAEQQQLEAQRKMEALRSRQQEEGKGRQKMQSDAQRPERAPVEPQAGREMEIKQRATAEAARAEGAARARELEGRARAQADQQQQQQRRQSMEQQQQAERAAGEQRRQRSEAADQPRRVPDAVREPVRPPREMQRPPAAPTDLPPGAPPAAETEKRGKDKKKDNSN